MLAQAWDSAHPLLERVKFLGISGTNLDEFFMVRLATLLKKYRAGIEDLSPDGLNTEQQLMAIRGRALTMMGSLSRCWNESLRPLLAAEGVHFLDVADFTPAINDYLANFFRTDIFPVLTPLAFDPGHPFPYISNLSKNLAVVVKHGGRTKFARVKVPDMLPRFVPVPENIAPKGGLTFAFLEDVIEHNIHELFPGTEVRGAHLFRIIRDTDMVIQEDEADDLLETVDKGLKQLRYGALSLLEVDATMPRRVLNILVENFAVEEDVVVRTADRMGLGDWRAIQKLHRPQLKDAPFSPRQLWDDNDIETIFDQIRYQDHLVHHPFDSFVAVESFLRAAIADPLVVAIKMTLYRIGQNSPLVDLLIDAAEQGKQVAVLVELKARFDERNNIAWANRLESAGIHVVYGLVNLKTHCKLCLVVRKEHDGIHRYAHVGTGNYNPVTSQIYTDLGLFTADQQIVDDVSQVFNYLTGYSHKRTYQRAAGRADRPARGDARPDRARGRARPGRAPGAHRHQEQRRRRSGDDQVPLPRLAGRPADRPDRARRLLPAARRPRHQRAHPRPLGRRPLPRALAHLLLRERGRAGGVHRQRRPDGAQPRSPGRGAVSGPRSRAAPAPARRGPRFPAARHGPGLCPAERRDLRRGRRGRPVGRGRRQQPAAPARLLHEAASAGRIARLRQGFGAASPPLSG